MIKALRFISLLLIAGLLIIQFFRIDKTNPTSDPQLDFLTIASPIAEIKTLIQEACYDCHSNQTKYPWYANVAPLSWWIKGHVDHGRGELNFSEWGAYSAKKRAHKMEESYEEIEHRAMPLKSFTWTHPEARLSDDQRARLIAWFKEREQLEK